MPEHTLTVGAVQRGSGRVVSTVEQPDVVPLSSVVRTLEAEWPECDIVVETVTDDEEETWFPSPDQLVRDTEAPHWSDDDRVRVSQVTNTPISEYQINGNPLRTVHAENPDYDETEVTVVGQYVDQSGDKEYAFPRSRLEPLE